MPGAHLLQLFYHVACAGGLSQAAKETPYDLDEADIDAEMIKLELEIGAPLFQRIPFQLTAAGEDLYARLKPRFEEFLKGFEKLREEFANRMCVAASPVVQQRYLPSILHSLKPKFPRLRFTLKVGSLTEIAKWVQDYEADLAIVVREGKVPPRCVSETVASLPLVLLVPNKSKIQTAEDLWAMDPSSVTLISPAEEDIVTRRFQQGLAKRSIDWNIGSHLDSLDLVELHVLQGFGIGVSVASPARDLPDGLRAVPLKGFPSLDVAMMCHRKPNRSAVGVIALLRKTAKALANAPAGKRKPR